MHHSTLKAIITTCIVLLLQQVDTATAQTVQWGSKIGSGGNDFTHAVKVGPNGNVYIGGAFSNTVDIDPSAGVYNLVSNGGEDIFLACYDPNGALLWGFSIGGNSYDAIEDIAVDAQNNVLICGYFRGQNVDFDPGAGVSLHSDNGVAGSSPFGGDGFVAKFNSSGVHQWSITMGGPWVYEGTECVDVDALGFVYVGGNYMDAMDLDPSTNNAIINATVDGKIFMAKYTPSGQFVWGHGFGTPGASGTDLAVRNMEIRGADVYICGFFEGSGDWDPYAGTTILTAGGIYDPYVGRYDTAGNLVWVDHIAATSGNNQAIDICLDAAGDVYITGFGESPNLNFGTNVPSAGGQDVFIARYSSTGVNQWARRYGSFGNDLGFSVIHSNGSIYCTGYFNGTVDFDPSTTTNNLVSAGASDDVYLVKYDLNGNYICGFNVGSTGHDEGYSLYPDASGNIYLGGMFSGTVDFDPSTAVYNLSGSGGLDAYLMKYIFSGGSSGYVVTGDTICAGQTPYITITDTANGGTFNVTITQGSNTYNFPNVQSGVPFALTPIPATTTSYTWSVNGGGGSACTGGGGSSGNFNVVVHPQPGAGAGQDITACSSIYVQLNGSGGGSYAWTPSSVLNDPNIANPTLTVTDTTLMFTLVVTDGNGCKDTDYVNISVHQAVAAANAGSDTSVCPGGPLQLQGSGNGFFNWYPSTGLNNANISTPVFTGGNNSVFNLVVTDQYGCTDTDQVAITMLPQLTANAGPDQLVCGGDSVTLQATGGTSYNWYPTLGMTGSNTADPTVYLIQTTTYSVIVSGSAGCADTDAVTISVIPVPDFDVVPEVHVCHGDSVMLIASGGNNYSWSPDNNISTISNDTVIVWPSNSTVYYVTISESQCGYSDSESVQVDVHTANVNIIKATPIGCGQKFGLLEATGAVQYSWMPAGSLSDPNISNPASLTTVSTVYTVTGTDQYGCVGTDTARIEVIDDNMTGLFVPSVFTPNNDGKNDCYRILLPQGITDYELHIYNRFGNNVFNADDASDCWDGTYNGEPCDLGTYYYYYKMKSPACDVKKEGKGDITLLK